MRRHAYNFPHRQRKLRRPPHTTHRAIDVAAISNVRCSCSLLMSLCIMGIRRFCFPIQVDKLDRTTTGVLLVSRNLCPADVGRELDRERFPRETKAIFGWAFFVLRAPEVLRLHVFFSFAFSPTRRLLGVHIPPCLLFLTASLSAAMHAFLPAGTIKSKCIFGASRHLPSVISHSSQFCFGNVHAEVPLSTSTPFHPSPKREQSFPYERPSCSHSRRERYIFFVFAVRSQEEREAREGDAEE